jgi:hypothetical protein
MTEKNLKFFPVWLSFSRKLSILNTQRDASYSCNNFKRWHIFSEIGPECKTAKQCLFGVIGLQRRYVRRWDSLQSFFIPISQDIIVSNTRTSQTFLLLESCHLFLKRSKSDCINWMLHQGSVSQKTLRLRPETSVDCKCCKTDDYVSNSWHENIFLYPKY